MVRSNLFCGILSRAETVSLLLIFQRESLLPNIMISFSVCSKASLDYF